MVGVAICGERVFSQVPGPVFLVGAPRLHPSLLGCQGCQGARGRDAKRSVCLSASLPLWASPPHSCDRIPPTPVAACSSASALHPSLECLCSALPHPERHPLYHLLTGTAKLSTPGCWRSVQDHPRFPSAWTSLCLTNGTSSFFSKSQALFHTLFWLISFFYFSLASPTSAYRSVSVLPGSIPYHLPCNDLSGPLEPHHLLLYHDLCLSAAAAIHAFSLSRDSSPSPVPGTGGALQGVYQMNKYLEYRE